ncbi:hypothetical protein CEXT_782211 [Caerostris extrusa]|uniref:Uncharacterized protein n=1 Tax=Caerostris extrusa TaxID=172846 RepID=A0AAV4Y8L0_CAEEX|nr:hypothetical protein CEXT_782211 [Caerostris extrusa]
MAALRGLRNFGVTMKNSIPLCKSGSFPVLVFEFGKIFRHFSAKELNEYPMRSTIPKTVEEGKRGQSLQHMSQLMLGFLLELELPAVGNCFGVISRGNFYVVGVLFELWNCVLRAHGFYFFPVFDVVIC